MRRLKFQIKKTLKNKFNYIPVALLLIIITGFLYLNASAVKSQSVQTYLRAEIADLQDVIKTEQAELKGQKGTEKNKFQDAINENQLILTRDQDILDYMSQGNWKAAYPLLVEETKQEQQIPMPNGQTLPADAQTFYKREILMYQALAQRNVPFQDTDLSTQGTTFTMNMMQYLMPPLLVLGIIYLLVSLFAGSFRERINLDLLLPRSKTNLYFTSLTTGAIISLMVFFVSLAFSFALSSISYGMGSWTYPILSYNFKSGAMYFQNLFNIVLPSLILQVLSIIFAVCLVYLVSYLLRDRLASLFISLLLIVGVLLSVNVIEPLHKVAQYLPTTYLNAVSVVTGEYANSLHNFSVSFSNGVLFLLGYIFILIATTIFLQKNILKN